MLNHSGEINGAKDIQFECEMRTWYDIISAGQAGTVNRLATGEKISGFRKKSIECLTLDVDR